MSLINYIQMFNKGYKATSCLLYFVMVFIISSCANKMKGPIKKEYLHAGPGYSKSVSVLSNNVKTIYVAGLTGEGNDLESQTRSTFLNIKSELELSGASLKDIVKMNTYIVNYKTEFIDTFRSVRKELLGEKDMPASTVVGVHALAAKNKLIEIEAVAVIKLKD